MYKSREWNIEIGKTIICYRKQFKQIDACELSTTNLEIINRIILNKCSEIIFRPIQFFLLLVQFVFVIFLYEMSRSSSSLFNRCGVKKRDFLKCSWLTMASSRRIRQRRKLIATFSSTSYVPMSGVFRKETRFNVESLTLALLTHWGFLH